MVAHVRRAGDEIVIEVERAYALHLEDKRHIVPCAGGDGRTCPKGIGAATRGHLGRELIICIHIDHRRVVVRRP